MRRSYSYQIHKPLMMGRHCTIFWLLLMASPLTVAETAECTKITMSTISWVEIFRPPTSGGEGDGPGWLLMRDIEKHLGVEVSLQAKGPFARELQLLYAGERDAIISLYPVDRRKKSFDFTEPYYREKLYVYTRKNFDNEIRAIKDLDGFIGSVVRSASLGKELDQYFLNSHALILINDDQQHLPLLLSGRTDFFINSPVTTREYLRKAKAETKVKRSTIPIAEANVAMAFSKKSPCRAWIPAINRIIQSNFTRYAASNR